MYDQIISLLDHTDLALNILKAFTKDKTGVANIENYGRKTRQKY